MTDRRSFFKQLASGVIAASSAGLFLPKLIKPAWKPHKLYYSGGNEYGWSHLKNNSPTDIYIDFASRRSELLMGTAVKPGQWVAFIADDWRPVKAHGTGERMSFQIYSLEL